MTKAKHSANFKLSQRNAWLLWLCQTLNISTLASQLSAWMLGVLALVLLWQALLLSRLSASKLTESVFIFHPNKQKHDHATRTKQRAEPNVSRYLLMLFAIGGCIAIAISAKSFGVLTSMVHLLTFAYALKAFEVKRRKDFYQHMLLGLFLLASALIFEQSIFFSLLILALIIANLTVIHQVFSSLNSLVKTSKTVAMLLLQSSVLAITLFIVFPRLSPFWQVPLSKSAKTGLSDVVRPGDIANLALSSELAFRVSFNGQSIPAYSSLYWRAMTLENYDGRQWTRAKKTPQNSPLFSSDKKAGSGISYQVIAPASYQHWLFALAAPSSSDPKIVFQEDYTIQSRAIITQTINYQVQSFPQAPIALTLSNESRQLNLAIVPNSNPKLEQLALTLKAEYSSPLALAQAVLNTFRTQEYYYSLQAPTLINNSLDQFYFNTKSGFCVHYASSFTYLMRAAGIPARVVTGYLGGEYNGQSSDNNSTQGGHLNIYQYDAHAWSEIWIEGVGWYRVDPTAAVDPQRVNQGWSSQLLAQQSELNNDLISLYQFKQMAWLNAIRLKLDAIDYQWTKWVIGYSGKRQYDLLKRWFGQHMPWKTGAIIAIALMLVMSTFTLFYRLGLARKEKKINTPAQRLYYQCLTALANKGITKHSSQSVMQFCAVIDQKIPELSQDFEQLSLLFSHLQYQQYTTKEEQALLHDLRQGVRNFKIRLKSIRIINKDDKNNVNDNNQLA